MPPIVPPTKALPQPGPPVNAVSTDSNLPAVQGTSAISTNPLEPGLGGGAGVIGGSGSGVGVTGTSTSNWGVGGTSQSGAGVVGNSNSNNGVAGYSVTLNGVMASSQKGPGLWAEGIPAGYFNGDVRVTGDLILINSASADIAEDFDVEEDPANAEPGTVLVIHPTGKLAACTEPYDIRVAGVVSGAGDLRPAIILQRLQHRPDRSPLALVGKALCKVDAAFGGIAAGDLLTTSATPGHAMKVADRTKAVGAILGKALYPLNTGRGLVPILISLR